MVTPSSEDAKVSSPRDRHSLPGNECRLSNDGLLRSFSSGVIVSCFNLRRAVPGDRDSMVDIWWRSARATHHFVSARDFETLLPRVRALRLETLQTWVLCVSHSEAI